MEIQRKKEGIPKVVFPRDYNESENDADNESWSNAEDEDEGSMWEYWKRLRKRAQMKAESVAEDEDYSKYFTNSLW